MNTSDLRTSTAGVVCGAGLLLAGWAQGSDVYSGKSLVRVARTAAGQIDWAEGERIVTHEDMSFIKVVLSGARIRQIEESGVRLEILVPRLGERIEEERARLVAFAEKNEQRLPGESNEAQALNWGGWFDDYQSGSAVNAYLDTLASPGAGAH